MIITAFFQLVFLLPQVVVQWANSGSALNITLMESDVSLSGCMNSGVEVKYRYDIKVCAKSNFWFDDCTQKYREIRTIQYDVVSETYSVTRDIFLDKEEPKTVVFSSADDAIRSLLRVEGLELKSMGNEADQLLKEKNVYLGLRVRGFCQEDEKNTILQIPYYLTFGMLKVTGIDTGWIDFSLSR